MSASKLRLDALLAHVNQAARTRLLAAAAPHSGAWPLVILVESLGLLFDEAVHENVAQRMDLHVQHLD